jgi:hypothetical protein
MLFIIRIAKKLVKKKQAAPFLGTANPIYITFFDRYHTIAGWE